MKVIFDCTALAGWEGHPTGIQRVVIEVGRRLCNRSSTVLLGLFSNSGRCYRYDIERRQRGILIEVCPGDLIVTAGSNWDYPAHHARLLDLGANGVMIVPLIYDIIPMILPFSYGPGFSEIYEKWFRETIANAELVFAISQNTRKDIIDFAFKNDLVCPDVYAIRLGDEVPTSIEMPTQRILNKTECPYILSVGTLEYRKNHILLLNAYRYMVGVQSYEPPQLLIVGKKGWLDHDIEYQVANDPCLSGRISILQGVSDADLQYLYQNALFTVYPSVYEGWGLPIAESLCFGTPCIASGTSSMTEVGPGLVKHAHPLRLDEWVSAIREFSDKPEELRRVAHKIQTSYERVGWEVAALGIFDALVKNYPEILNVNTELASDKNMNIYFDCSTILNWQGSMTGIPRTVYCIASALQGLHPDIRFVALDEKEDCFCLLSGELGHFRIDKPVGLSKGDVFFSAGAGWAIASYREQIRRIKSQGVKFYQLFYDLIPALFPYFYEQGTGFGDYFANWNRDIFDLCDGTYSISECTKRDMISMFDINEERAKSIKVIRLGENFSPVAQSRVEMTRFGWDDDFLLCVGTLEIRKNQICLLNAYRLLIERHGNRLPKLILVGRNGWMDGEILFQINNDRLLNGLVQVLTDVDDNELQWLYENCLFSLYPSLYEGWGLPVAESLRAGRPCISSGVSSMLEIAPEITVFASPHNPESWAAAILYFISHPDKLNELAQRVKRDYFPTSWTSTAESIIKVIKRENIQ